MDHNDHLAQIQKKVISLQGKLSQATLCDKSLVDKLDIIGYHGKLY